MIIYIDHYSPDLRSPISTYSKVFAVEFLKFEIIADIGFTTSGHENPDLNSYSKSIFLLQISTLNCYFQAHWLGIFKDLGDPLQIRYRLVYGAMLSCHAP